MLSDMLFEPIMLSVCMMGTKTPLDAGNSSTTRNSLLTEKTSEVKMTMTRGQSAWVIDEKLPSPSETQRGGSSSNTVDQKDTAYFKQ